MCYWRLCNRGIQARISNWMGGRKENYRFHQVIPTSDSDQNTNRKANLPTSPIINGNEGGKAAPTVPRGPQYQLKRHSLPPKNEISKRPQVRFSLELVHPQNRIICESTGLVFRLWCRDRDSKYLSWWQNIVKYEVKGCWHMGKYYTLLAIVDPSPKENYWFGGDPEGGLGILCIVLT